MTCKLCANPKILRMGMCERHYRIDVRNRRGEPNKVSTAECREHLVGLMGEGMTSNRIHVLSGKVTTRWTINKIVSGEAQTARQDAVTALMAVRNIPLPIIKPRPRGNIDRIPRSEVTGLRRRVRALMSIGHDFSALEASTGVAKHILEMVASRSVSRVSVTEANAIKETFDRLRNTVIQNHEVIAYARRNYYPRPWSWIGEDIDDPTIREVGLDVQEIMKENREYELRKS